MNCIYEIKIQIRKDILKIIMIMYLYNCILFSAIYHNCKNGDRIISIISLFTYQDILDVFLSHLNPY